MNRIIYVMFIEVGRDSEVYSTVMRSDETRDAAIAGMLPIVPDIHIGSMALTELLLH